MKFGKCPEFVVWSGGQIAGTCALNIESKYMQCKLVHWLKYSLLPFVIRAPDTFYLLTEPEFCVVVNCYWVAQ